MAYELPDHGASYEIWQAACADLSRVRFTIPAMEEGFAIILDDEALQYFGKSLHKANPDLAIAALRARYEMWAEAWDNGIDLKKQQPDVYRSLAERPLTPEDFNIFPAFEDAED